MLKGFVRLVILASENSIRHSICFLELNNINGFHVILTPMSKHKKNSKRINLIVNSSGFMKERLFKETNKFGVFQQIYIKLTLRVLTFVRRKGISSFISKVLSIKKEE